jgi:hypothetical protein
MKLKQAIKELREGWNQCCCPDGWRECDRARVLAAAYLAEHPADDDEPITREWLVDLGWTVRERDVWMAYPSHLSQSLAIDGNGRVYLALMTLGKPVKTRRDLRRLTNVLGIANLLLITKPRED